jgi:two-component system nitrogen regulation response regulator NtrX
MKKVNLLLVDDEQKVINTWKKWFDSPRYSISEANSGEEATTFVKRLKEENENAMLVVLLDVIMPGLDGIDVLARIKGEFPFSKVYIITGNVQTENIPDTAYNTGIYRGDGFFQKQTIDFDKLVQEVEKGIKEQEIQFDFKKKVQ